MPQPRRKLEPPIYAFHVRIAGGLYASEDMADITRDIEIAGSQTLTDLARAILAAYEFDEDHLWSFFLSGKPWDRKTEYALIAEPGLPGERPPRLAGKHTLRDVTLPRHEFIFLFDYGDEWMFGVKLTGTSKELETKARYPRVVASQGDAPPQYPDLDEEDWDDDEEFDEDEED